MGTEGIDFGTEKVDLNTEEVVAATVLPLITRSRHYSV